VKKNSAGRIEKQAQRQRDHNALGIA
jgi:hypothetical protein